MFTLKSTSDIVFSFSISIHTTFKITFIQKDECFQENIELKDFINSWAVLFDFFPCSAANMTKKDHVHEEFSTPQLPNKCLLIISNWPSFLTDRWLQHMKALVIVRVAAFMWKVGGG